MMKGIDKVYQVGSGAIFVFGSNLAGIHGAGAAKDAYQMHGAIWGCNEGRQGSSYAIPTKSSNVADTLPLTTIQACVETFLQYAAAHPELSFFVTRIGCGRAGYSDDDIGPMFKGAPPNCELPHGWR